MSQSTTTPPVIVVSSGLAYANYAKDPHQVSFLWRVELSTDSLCCCLLQCLFSVYSFQIWLPCSPVLAWPLGFAPLQPSREFPRQAYVTSGNGLWSMPGVPWVATASTSSSRKRASYYSINWHPAIQSVCRVYSFGGLAELLNPTSSFQTWWEGFLFSRFCFPDDMVNSEAVMGNEPCDFSVVIGYQVDISTIDSHLVDGAFCCSITHLQCVHKWGLTTNPLPIWTTVWGLCYFMEQTVADFEHSLDSIHTDSIEKLELDPSLNEPHVMTASVSSWFLCSFSTISDYSKLQPAYRIKSHKLWCQEHYFCLYPCWANCHLLNWFAVFITTVLVDTIASLQNSNGGSLQFQMCMNYFENSYHSGQCHV